MDDEHSQKHEEQSTEPLLQITNCASSSKADSSVAVINSESDGIRSFSPSVMENWVRYYLRSLGDTCLENTYASLSVYLERKALPTTCEFNVKVYNTCFIMMLMHSNLDFFRNSMLKSVIVCLIQNGILV